MKKVKAISIMGFVALIVVIMVMPAAAAFEPGECDIYVYSGQSIDAAVDSASDGQTVCVYNGTYSGVISVNTPNITLKGEGADVVTYQDDTVYIVFGDTGDASGCIIEGFKIVNTNKGIQVMEPAPNCIIRSCAFELTNPDNGILIGAMNTSFMNNVVLNSLPAYGTVQPWAASCILVNNTFIDNPGAAMYLYLTPNSVFARNNFSNNSDIMVYDPGEGIKWYLNNFIDTSIGNPWGGPVPAVTYWNSTEQIEYVCPSDGTYTNYLGNYWSDYTTKYPGASEDGCGIWDTTYEVPDSLGEDYRPLMDKFENYFEEAEPTPTPTPTPGPVGVPEFNAMGLVALIGVLSVLLAVTTVGSKRKRRE